MTTKLLEVTASVRQHNSVSRQLSEFFISTWRSYHPNVEHVVRDVGMKPPAIPDDFWVKANYTLPESRTPEMIKSLAVSDQLIDELFAADYVVLAVPMYNLSVPSNFKVYIDNIVRVKRTFNFEQDSLTFEGLVTGKKCLLITPSAIDYSPDKPMAAMDFCEPYIRTVFGFIGIEEMECVKVPNQFMSDDIRKQVVETAKTQLLELAKIW